MRSFRAVTVNLKPGATAEHIVEMLSDLPPGLELTGVSQHINDDTGRCTAALRFHDWNIETPKSPQREKPFYGDT